MQAIIFRDDFRPKKLPISQKFTKTVYFLSISKNLDRNCWYEQCFDSNRCKNAFFANEITKKPSFFHENGLFINITRKTIVYYKFL